MKPTFVKSAPQIKDLPPLVRPYVGMFGRSNVGKSSLINQLAGEKNLARVSSEPGRTQMINVYDIDGTYLLADLPGYGFAKTSKSNREKFADLIDAFLWDAPNLVLIFLIIDARIGTTPLDVDMMERLEASNIPAVLVANKIDKLSRSEANSFKDKLASNYPGLHVIYHSAVTGTGRGEVVQAIEKAVRDATS